MKKFIPLSCTMSQAVKMLMAIVLVCVTITAVPAEASSTNIILSVDHDISHVAQDAIGAMSNGTLSKPVAGRPNNISFQWSKIGGSGALATFRGARYRHKCLHAYCPGPDMFALGQLGPGFLRTWTPTGVKGLYARDYAYFQFRRVSGVLKGKWVSCQAKIKAAGASDGIAVKLTRQVGTVKAKYLGQKSVKVGKLKKTAHATEYVFFDTLDSLNADRDDIEVRLVVRRVVREKLAGKLIKAGAGGKDAYASFISKPVRFAANEMR